ncbi:undecaprenyl/decaprenyl-phosphate alpha-N-acetylglucosaminyl 1-phosphate transferase [Candidatus Falkowbacteria bacterium]|jgi:UDP-GlcNAc:undecaprenyl-phosphate/decaprenyl-phosphate GlcNAc-1-phosphate transferase|nr:undecaprenyl/decaprenyl-phosphate alpha-N-acetylglucosaminyl 1-phosphate transferase [Candidatus Falkowbacteria bacterium]MBT7007173.1 undecaprenyl/decaprenyl-phosphate alpha-N-acetylglucosaminyl 1-phosphate transferase [Candidatus Falkowbacteria bacterium]
MNSSNYIFILVTTFIISLIATAVVIWFAKKVKALDIPNSKRKLHKKPIPLLGGLAVFFSFNLVLLFYLYFTNDLTGDTIRLRNIIGIMIGTLFLMIGGFLDDKYNLKPRWQILWPIFAVVSVIVGGIGIDWITNPFGEGLFYLNEYSVTLFWYEGFPYQVTFLADLLTFFWIMGMIYTTKLLDGLDGLVSGVAIIGGIFIFLTALNKSEIIQYDVALLAMIMIGAFAGFLVFNFNPAQIFLGEGGSTLAGFLLGSLSIISGSKIGVTLMLLSIPILDFLWTIIRRIMEKRSPFSGADRKHLHHRLLDAGLSVKKAVLTLYAVTVVFGVMVYYLQDFGLSFTGLALFSLIIFMLILAYAYKQTKERRREIR